LAQSGHPDTIVGPRHAAAFKQNGCRVDIDERAARKIPVFLLVEFVRGAVPIILDNSSTYCISTS
jgi:hypothetical protein